LIQAALKKFKGRRVVKGLAHITGGGFIDNIPRVLPKKCDAVIRKGSWEMPPIFQLLAAKGGVAEAELYQVFNMGIGMTMIVAAGKADAVLRFIRARGQTAWIIGEIVRAERAGQSRLTRDCEYFEELEWRGIGGRLHGRAGIAQSASSPARLSFTPDLIPPRTACTSAIWCRCWPCGGFNCTAIIPSPWPAGRPAWSAIRAGAPERQLLTKEVLDANIAGIKEQLRRLLDFDSAANPARLVDNADWTAPVSFLDFLRDIGKHFSVNQMMAKESVRARMEDRESGISYTEFSYMLLQAFDFFHLFQAYQCELQIGGSDQWGNITAGMELTRKKPARMSSG
jgi:hypothetical protein